MSSDAFYARQADDIARSYERCPKATALMNEAQRYLDEVLPAWPETGTPEANLKGFLEAVVVVVGLDRERGIEASDSDVTYVHSRMLAGR